MTTNMRHTCPPISLCSWWGTLKLSWCFPDLHCSRSEGGAAWIGWGSRRPGPSCFCHHVVSHDCWAQTLTRSGRPSWWAPPKWVVAQTSLFSSAQTKKKKYMSHQLPQNELYLTALSWKTEKKETLIAGFWSYLADLLVASLPNTRDVAARPQEIQGWWWVESEKRYTVKISQSKKQHAQQNLIKPKILLSNYCAFYISISHKTLADKMFKKWCTCSLCACWEVRWYTAGGWTSLTDVSARPTDRVCKQGFLVPETKKK